MNPKLSVVALVCVALLVSACASAPQNLIIGKWEVESAKAEGVDVGYGAVGKAINMTAEFSPDGTAKISMFGKTLQGNYKMTGDNELEWTMSGITTKSKVIVTANRLELTDPSNRTITYKRK